MRANTLAVGSWQLAVGGTQVSWWLAVGTAGGWRLTVGGWCLAVEESVGS